MRATLLFSAMTLVLGLSLSCCQSSKKTAGGGEQIQNDSSKKTAEQKNMSSETAATVPLKIQFFSIGQGIDYKLKASFLEWLKNYAAPAGKTLDYQEKYWGREGETDICFTLNDWQPANKAAFIAEAKKFVSGSKLVHVFENESCVKGR